MLNFHKNYIMGQIANKKLYKVKFPLSPQDYVIGTDPITGETITIEMGAIFGQNFDMSLFENSCLSYPRTRKKECDSLEPVELPLSFVQVLFRHQQLLCKTLDDIAFIESTINQIETTVNTLVVYNELANTEWTPSVSNATAVNVDISSQLDPQDGNNNISFCDISNAIDSTIKFDNGSLINSENLTELKFFLRNEPNSVPYKISIFFEKSGIPSFTEILLVDSTFGLDISNTSYQEITIPLTFSNFPASEIDSFTFKISPINEEDTLSKVYIDNIRLIEEIKTINSDIPDVTIELSKNQVDFPDNFIDLTAIVTDGSDVASYRWESLTGGNFFIVDPTSETTRVNGLTEGTYSFRVIVTDTAGNVGFDIATFVVGQGSNVTQVFENGNLITTDSDGNVTTTPISYTLNEDNTDGRQIVFSINGNELSRITLPEQVQSNWAENDTSSPAHILNRQLVDNRISQNETDIQTNENLANQAENTANIALQNAQNNQNEINAINQSQDNSKPAFFVEFEVTDTNPGGGDNPTRSISLVSSNNNSVSVGNLGSGFAIANSINISYSNLGFRPRVTNATGIDTTPTSTKIHIPPYSNLTSFRIKVYFFRDYISSDYTI